MQPAVAGHLAMLLFSVLVAGSFALGAMAANDIAPIALNAARFWLGAGVMGVAVWATGGVPRATFNAPWRYVVLAATFTLYFVLMFEGLKTAPPVSAAAVFTLTPLMAAGFGWVLLRQKTTWRMAGALGLGALGAVWVIFRADISAILRFEIGPGEWVYFWGCMSHALYTPLVRKLNRGEGALVFSFCVMVTGAVLLTVLGWREIWATAWTALPEIVWITIGYTAVFASATTFTLMQFATMRLPSAKVMAYTYLVPTWVMVWGLVLGDVLPPIWVLAGIGLTVLALLALLRE